MEAIAKAKYLKGSPRKARLVIDLIRGRNVSRALAILKFTNKRAAEPIAKCLNSAIANATYLAEQKNVAVDPDDLWIKTCFVDMGPHKNRRRMRPAPQGRAYREQRHYCHITIELTNDAPVKKEADKPRKEGKKLTAKRVQAEAKAAQADVKTSEKADTVKKTIKAEEAKVEEAENTATTASEQTAEPTVQKATETEQAKEQDANIEAEISDAKNVSSQTPAERNETQPADEKQQEINEELERQ